MNDDLIKKLRGVCHTDARYPVLAWLHEAADTIERLTKERDEARAKALREAALRVVTGKHGAVLHSPSPERTEMSDEILALIDKPDPANG